MNSTVIISGSWGHEPGRSGQCGIVICHLAKDFIYYRRQLSKTVEMFQRPRIQLKKVDYTLAIG